MFDKLSEKKVTVENAGIAVCVAVLVSMVFGIWVGTPDTPTVKQHPDQILLEGDDYQFKYAREVCRQRNARPHFIGSGHSRWIVCMDNDTKLLSDFD